MSTDAWLSVVFTVVAVTALARRWVAPEVAVLGPVLVLTMGGVLTPAEAFGSFGSEAVLSIAALLVVAAGVRKTGLLGLAADATLGRARQREPLLRLLLPSAALSAVLNNTPLVAILTPAILDWCKRREVPPSRLLMPMCFAVSLGGTCTLIGTSSNLVVSGLMRQHGMAEMGLLELGKVGVPVTLAGLLLIWGLSRFVLPGRRDPLSALKTERRQYLVEMLVDPGSSMAGRTIAEAGLRQLSGLFLMSIGRSGRFIGPVGPEERLESGDRLVFTGMAATVVELLRINGLSPAPEARYDPTAAERHGRIFEAVVSANSPLVGRTLKEAGFRRRYDAAVIAVHRADQRLPMKLGDVVLKPGDTLMVEADDGFYETWSDSVDFALISRMKASSSRGPHKAPHALLILVAMSLAVALDWLPMVLASFTAAGALVVLGVLTPGEARKAVELPLLCVIAGSLGLGLALQRTGAASTLGSGLIALFGSAGPNVLLLGCFLLTFLVTQFITNSAAAALTFPIVHSAAVASGLDPRPFAMGLAVAASASFLTPVGYQTNLMIYGPGGYRFGDYARLGVPLSLVVIGVALLSLRFFWPLG